MKFLSAFKNPFYIYGSSYLFLILLSWALWWALFPVWLQEKIGLDGAALGTVYAVNQAVSVVYTLIYGFMQDRLGLRKNLISFVSFVMVFTGPFFVFAYEPLLKNYFYLGVILGAIFLSACFLSGASLLETFVEKMSRGYNYEYGTARAWGSFGYALGALIAGYIFVKNPHLLFWLSSVFGIMFFIVNLSYKNKKQYRSARQGPKIRKSDFIKIFKDKNFWIFVIFIMGTWSFYTIYDQQMFPNFYKGLFRTPEIGVQVYSTLNFTQVLLESLCMAIMPFVVNKIGAKRGLLLGCIIMVTRIFGTSTFDNVYLVSFVKMFHSLEVPLFIISVFKYATSNFDQRLSATVYLIGFQLASSFGIVILSRPIGAFFDKHGYITTFHLFASIVFTMIVLGFFFLSNRKKPQ